MSSQDNCEVQVRQLCVLCKTLKCYVNLRGSPSSYGYYDTVLLLSPFLLPLSLLHLYFTITTFRTLSILEGMKTSRQLQI